MHSNGAELVKSYDCRQIAFVVACLVVSAAGADPKINGNAAPPPSTDDPAIVEHFKRAFAEGFVVGPKRLQEAQKHLTQARRLAPRDPRLDYALGLILVRQSQLKQAIDQFQAAIENDESYWPAWQAAVWTQLAEKRYEPGLRQLVAFAAIVRASEKPDDVSEAQRDAARWIGQVIVALSNSDETRRLDKLLAASANEILKALGEGLWGALEEGRDSIAARDLALGPAGKVVQSTDKYQQARQERQAALLDKTLEGAGNAKENLDKDKQEWKRWIDDELAHYDKLLNGLERDFKFLDEQVLSLTQSMNRVVQELSTMQLVVSTIDSRNANALGMENAQQQYLERQKQYLSYQTEYNSTAARMSEVVRTGSQAVEKRAGAIAEYEKSTGDLVKKNASLDKWSTRLKDQKQKLAVNKPVGKGNKTGARDQKAPPPTFKTFLPFDPQRERDRLLASFGRED